MFVSPASPSRFGELWLWSVEPSSLVRASRSLSWSFLERSDLHLTPQDSFCEVWTVSLFYSVMAIRIYNKSWTLKILSQLTVGGFLYIVIQPVKRMAVEVWFIFYMKLLIEATLCSQIFLCCVHGCINVQSFSRLSHWRGFAQVLFVLLKKFQALVSPLKPSFASINSWLKFVLVILILYFSTILLFFFIRKRKVVPWKIKEF